MCSLQVKWWKVSDDVRSAQKKYMGWIQETIVQGLQKQTVYVLRVAGWSGGGDGLGSDPVYFTVLGEYWVPRLYNFF